MSPDPVSASLWVVRTYECAAGLLFVLGLVWVWRRGEALYGGAYLGSSLGGGLFEWVFDGRYFFRLTSDEKFIPAWTIEGVQAPVAMILFYAFFFGIPLIAVLLWQEPLTRRFGRFSPYLLFAVMGVLGTPLFECTNTSVAHIYEYHQRESFLLWGMPWSNLWFGVLMFACPYWGLVQARALLKGYGLPNKRRLAFALGFASIISGFFVASAINGVWYAWAEPWSNSPRPF